MATPPIDAVLREEDAADPARLSRVMTRFMTAVRTTLTKGMTLKDNGLGLVKLITIAVTSPWTDVYVDVSALGTAPTGCIPTFIQDTGTTDPSLSGVWLDWRPATLNGKQCVRIRNISGLTAGHTYNIRIEVTGGNDA